MIRLGVPREPRWVDMPMGVRLRMRPAITALWQAARWRADRTLRDAEAAWKAAHDAGLPVDGPVLDDDGRKAAFLFMMTCIELARECVMDWEGVGDVTGSPMPFTPDGLAELMSHNGMAEAFWAAVTANAAAVDAEGNA